MQSLDKPLLGTVYLVDQEKGPEKRRFDIERIAAAGLDLIVIWPPVSRWDAPDGVSMAYDSIDNTLDLCSEFELKAIIEIEGQNPAYQFMPDYLYKPEYMMDSPLARQWANYFHPEVDKIIIDFCKEAAAHYKGHPALWGYDVFNEVNFDSRDPWTEKAFREWLKNKYSSIKEMNRIWGRFYTDFDQIHLHNTNPLDGRFTYSNWSSLRPRLDFEDFRSDSIAMWVRKWGDAIKSVDPDAVIIADNSYSMTAFSTMQLGNDDWKVSAQTDVFGLSIYPKSWGINEPAHRISQVLRGGISACPDKPVMLSELQTHCQTIVSAGSSIEDEILLWTWHAFAEGAQGLVYWKWNPFIRGTQVAGRGMTSQDGKPNYRSDQAAEIAGILKKNPDLFTQSKLYDSSVALWYDPVCDRFIELTQKGGDTADLYREHFSGWFNYLFSKGIAPLFVQPQDISKDHTQHIKLLIIPLGAMISKAAQKDITAFIEKGGKVIADGRFCVTDENGIAYECAPDELTEVFGYSERDYRAPYDDEAAMVADRFSVIGLSHAQCDTQSTSGDPLWAETKNTLYLTGFNGLDMAKEPYRSKIDAFVNANIDTTCQVLEKGEATDVIIRRIANGLFVAAVNYSHITDRIKVKLDQSGTIENLFAYGSAAIEKTEDGIILTADIPARKPGGWVLKR